MPSSEQIKNELEAIKTLKSEFGSAYEEATTTAANPEAAKQALEKAKKLRSEIEIKMASLREQINPFERELQLKEQYEKQRDILQKTGILERFTNGEMGIKGIDGKEYPCPKLEDVARRLRDKRETLKPKMEQGFQKLLIIPFGMPLGELIEKYKEVILKHHQSGKLLATKRDPSDPDEPLKLDANKPVYVWDEYIDADKNGKLIYNIHQYPPMDTQSNQRLPYDIARDGGATKQELLSYEGGFRICLIEDNPNIPREGKGEEKGKRKQLEANRTPQEYLAMVGKDSYQEEAGMSPEDWLAYAITQLEETNQVIDDYQGKGSISYQVGAYFQASGYVPNAHWNRTYLQTDLRRSNPGFRAELVGVRSAVRV